MTDIGSEILTLDDALQQAIAHHQAGRAREAERLYLSILKAQPDHADANHNLGVLAGQAGQLAAGLPYLRKALAINPSHQQYLSSYAYALLLNGQAGEAMNILQTAQQRGINTPALQALQNEARAALRNGAGQNDASASAEIEQLIGLFNAKRWAELENRACMLVEQHPDFGFAWKILGASLHMQGKDALHALRRATELLHDDHEAHANLGNALKDLGQLDEAIACYNRALAINPRFVEAYNNQGVALLALRRFDDAIASYRKALTIRPDYAQAHSNLGNAQRDIGQLEDAIDSYRRALAINPDFIEAHDNLLFINNYRIDQPATALLREARHFGNLVARQARPYTHWDNIPDPGRCLRVGFVSGDLCNHPVGRFVQGVLAALSSSFANHLTLLAYPCNARTDALSERIKACCSNWYSATGVSDENLARQIRGDSIDILIDLSGHTAYNRLPLFAWKPAPIQVTWLGYLATTGVAAMDYLIADPWTLPETEERYFTEKIWRLPETYLCFTPPDADEKVAPLPALSNGYITFGCFNNLIKMNDAVVALWARVLSAVPDSRLSLKSKQLAQASVRQGIAERFAAHGIGADRLILNGLAPQGEYLASFHHVDIALDPFPYPGITTSIENLWMGVPVLTLAGESFLSRQGIGMLMNAGMPDWIAADADEYVSRAVSHSGNLQRLASLRGGLREQLLASPLFDAPRFARHFEAALRGMWQKWCGQQQ